jgi:CheY-like chemotaxis protein
MHADFVPRVAEVLLVEDNPGDIRLTKEALRYGDVPVKLSVAMDGVEALDFLRRRGRFKTAPRPDLILLDLNLPRKNGREVLSEIKSDGDLRSIPVLVITTSQSPQDVERAYTLNANCYITKPVEFDAFVDLLRSLEDFWLTKATLPAENGPKLFSSCPACA